MPGVEGYYRFPSNLGTEQINQYVKFKVYNQGSLNFVINMFNPAAGGQSQLSWEMVHDYEEVKLTKLGMGVIGAVSQTAASAIGAAAGAARLLGKGAINPKVDVLFSNTQLRRFQFDFFMAPSSAADAQMMNAIVKTFRKYSSPALTFGNASGQTIRSGLWFNPPAEFDISFHRISDGNTEENNFLPRIARSVLTKVDVIYGGQQPYSTFKDGSPTQAQLTLMFNEMRVISQEDVEDGY